jgi:2-oxoglutarate dehydrogenase dihydrolipoamide succinyltransferase (E2 component)
MTSIQMPQLGETIVEGTILKWLKQEGDEVARDEPLFEISTDKVDTEVPSPVAGTVTKILVAEGETVPVGTELAEIGGEEDTGPGPDAPGDSAGAVAEGSGPDAPAAEPASPVAEAAGVATGAAAAPAGQQQTGAPPPNAVSLPDRGGRSQVLSPVVRRLANEHGLDLSRIQGSGDGGRITRKDVEAAIAAEAERPAPAAAGPEAPAPAIQPAPAVAAGEGTETQPMSHIRKAIAQHMVASNQNSARAWTLVEANVEHLVRLRERAKDSFAERHGVKLTYLPFFVRATVDALREYPMVNARLDGEQIVLHRYVNMGIAVSYDQGLIVPVIRGADAMNSVGIARAIADLAARARAHQLQPDEVQGATFTITNPGPYGSVASVPIINQPNSGILSIDGIQKRPVVVDDDAIAVRHMVNVSMSWDHRMVDGEIATRFLARVKQNLESWDFAEDLGL